MHAFVLVVRARNEQCDEDRLRAVQEPGAPLSLQRGEGVKQFVLFYESADDVVTKAPAVFPEHLARLRAFRARGVLLMVGTFDDPQRDGSMAMFATREAAEEFATGDPFV